MSRLHVVPNGDHIEHDSYTEGECVCGPETMPVEKDDGSFTYIYVHHSLDGRELGEPV